MDTGVSTVASASTSQATVGRVEPAGSGGGGGAGGGAGANASAESAAASRRSHGGTGSNTGRRSANANGRRRIGGGRRSSSTAAAAAAAATAARGPVLPAAEESGLNEAYLRTTMGEAVVETLKTMTDNNTLSHHLAAQVVRTFDECMDEALANISASEQAIYDVSTAGCVCACMLTLFERWRCHADPAAPLHSLWVFVFGWMQGHMKWFQNAGGYWRLELEAGTLQSPLKQSRAAGVDKSRDYTRGQTASVASDPRGSRRGRNKTSRLPGLLTHKYPVARLSVHGRTVERKKPTR